MGLANATAQIGGVEAGNRGFGVAMNHMVDTDQTSCSAFVIGPL